MHSPTRSPTRTRRQTNGDIPSFMRRPPKPDGVKDRRANPAVTSLSPAELEERYQHNARILAETSTSSSTFIRQLEDEQAAIRARLGEVGVEGIRSQLEHTRIQEDDSMNVDPSPNPPPPPQEEPRPIGAKQRALARWNAAHGGDAPQAGGMSSDEAAKILQETFRREQEHKAKVMDRRRRRGEMISGEHLTRAEKDARMLAFLTYKPTDSDLEDDDDDEEDEEDEEGRPSWFDEDDQEDGVKGQDIVEPDYEDLSSIIRIDEARIPWAIPREE
ncbi:hypothetical protein L226DRAFT_529428 [Lentinus tigrinus ALCF2SS1-7]|uniref:Uncharacterized protein n=1 Tax=Lentinus tigrinus ALCF2SS1-6 TaxID=1328759 RepID=A0A5C2STR7_9APHY|nr:hypothetical protein L227DRAFT_569234 [Lentinus tigrinus ALCF2SS1-6]RPD80983.1 hypothetical protein L226DRAFT_529428 [Lentinus tigrinus ALCF2SS1-7]